MTLVSLHGKSLTLQGIPHTPEINGQGAYAKGWKRENDNLFLYKLGVKEHDDIEAKIEVSVSRILDRCNVEHVVYEPAKEIDGRIASKCLCMTTEDLSIMSGLDYYSYCNANGMNSTMKMIVL